MTSIAVVAAGISVPSTTRLLADRFVEKLTYLHHAQGPAAAMDLDIQVIELRDIAHPIMDAMLTGFSTGKLKEAIDVVTAADGLVVASPVFNASFSGLFKSFFDVIEPGSLAGKPVLLAANGGSERHSLITESALRPLFSYAHALTVPTAVYAATSDFGSDSGLDERISKASAELLGLIVQNPAKTVAAGGIMPDFVPFAELLGA